MRSVTDMAEWLLAQIDEDERRARVAGNTPSRLGVSRERRNTLNIKGDTGA